MRRESVRVIYLKNLIKLNEDSIKFYNEEKEYYRGTDKEFNEMIESLLTKNKEYQKEINDRLNGQIYES